MPKPHLKNPDLYLKAWRSGQLCLHLSDTLPGLSFHPELPLAQQALLSYKGRPADKPCISLVASLDLARKYWQPLPAKVEKALGELWPGPLSVAWKASDLAPPALVASDGYLALRCPLLSPKCQWLQEILVTCSLPFPSTSVNRSGEPAAQSWQEALELVKGSTVFVPDLEAVLKESINTPKPSTLIKVQEDGKMIILREGAVPSAVILRY